MGIFGNFDGSGDGKTPIQSVGGFIATDVGWKNFETQWEAALEFGGVPYLHMREFAHHLPPYEHFKTGTERRNEFMRRLIEATRNLKTGISVVLSRE